MPPLEITDKLPEATTGNKSDGDNQPVISVRGLSKVLNHRRILTNISFDIGHGEMLVVLGPSGGGKTTLLRIIAGLEAPDRVCREKDIDSDPRISKLRPWGKRFVHTT